MRFHFKAAAFSALLGAGLAMSGTAQACTGGSAMTGAFGFFVHGFDSSNGKLSFTVGEMTFDGKCGLFGYYARALNGTVIKSIPASGTYALNSDNTITIILTPWSGAQPYTFNVAYSKTSMEADGVELDPATPGVVAAVSFKAQISNPAVAAPVYNAALLKGGWVATCFATNGATDLNLINFDGAGNIMPSSVDAYNNGGVQGDLPYTGTYAMNTAYWYVTDGEFAGSVNVGGVAGQNVYNFWGIVDKQGNEIQYIYYLPNGAPVTACEGKRL